MSMRDCIMNNELTLHVVDTYDEPVALVQFINKQGTIGVKYFYDGCRWYL